MHERFLATIALENNTGLDGAEVHVADMVAFLRNYGHDTHQAGIGKVCPLLALFITSKAP